MCGIFGQLEQRLSPSAREPFTERATAALTHRGPDASGHVHDEHCLLGHTRLKILDLSHAAAQPMRSASGRSVLVHNGEIYNYLELREGAAPPAGFRSRSDTEVLLELLERRGRDALAELRGMFAFAVWSPGTRELLLARDRLGKKPLYWARTTTGGLRFASELCGLFADGAIPRRTSPERIAEFLQYGYNLAPRTSFVGVEALPPAHYLVARVGDDGIEVRVERYWELPAYRPAPLHEFPRWADEFAATLEDAVRVRMRADVPVGAFLSGGIDSSIVAMLASREIGGGLRTITVDYPDDRALSEAAYAHEVAVHIDADHKRLVLPPPTTDDLDDLVRIYGELHGDVSALATIGISRATRDQVTVALTGDGADEVMGGYARYFRAIEASARARRWPKSVVAGAEGIASHLPGWVRGDGTLALYNDDPGRAYVALVRQFPARSTPPLFRAPVRFVDPVEAALRKHGARPPLARMMAADMETYIPGDTNVSLDRASMAVGLELRSPFLDHRLFELVARARPEWIIDGDRGKLPLRYLYGSELPASVFSRPKLGFGVPTGAWFRGHAFAKMTARLLDPRSRIYEVLDRGKVAALVSGYEWKLHRAAGRLWNLLVLDAWFEYWRTSIA